MRVTHQGIHNALTAKPPQRCGTWCRSLTLLYPPQVLTARTAEATPAPISGYTLREVDAASLNFSRPVKTKHRTSDKTDENGVPMNDIAGSLVYNPTTISQYALRMIANFTFFEDDEALAIAESCGSLLAKIGVEEKGALFVPYEFDYTLSGRRRQLLKAPWYSGMAQGQVLQVFCRLFLATGDERYLHRADQVYASLITFDQADLPYTNHVDVDGLAWIEEYPNSDYLGTLNGHNFAIQGLYDYWLITKDASASKLIDATMTTVRLTLERDFRVPGEPSLYCRNQMTQADGYHVIHIGQLLDFYRFTADSRFAKLAIELHDDYPAWLVSGELMVPAGTHMTFTATLLKPSLIVEPADALTLTKDTSFRVVGRRRLKSAETYYYTVINEAGEVLIFEESDEISMAGPLTGAELFAGPISGTQMVFDPPLAGQHDGTTVQITDVTIVDRVSQAHMLTADGTDGGYVPMGRVTIR